MKNICPKYPSVLNHVKISNCINDLFQNFYCYKIFTETCQNAQYFGKTGQKNEENAQYKFYTPINRVICPPPYSNVTCTLASQPWSFFDVKTELLNTLHFGAVLLQVTARSLTLDLISLHSTFVYDNLI